MLVQKQPHPKLGKGTPVIVCYPLCYQIIKIKAQLLNSGKRHFSLIVNSAVNRLITSSLWFPLPISCTAAFKAEVLSILFWLYHKTAKYAKALLYSPLFRLEIYPTFYHEHSVIYLWTFPSILMIDMENIWSKTKCLLLYLIIPLQSRGRALRDVLGIPFHWYHDDLACFKFQPWKNTPYKNSRVLMAFIHHIWDSPML